MSSTLCPHRDYKAFRQGPNRGQPWGCRKHGVWWMGTNITSGPCFHTFVSARKIFNSGFPSWNHFVHAHPKPTRVHVPPLAAPPVEDHRSIGLLPRSTKPTVSGRASPLTACSINVRGKGGYTSTINTVLYIPTQYTRAHGAAPGTLGCTALQAATRVPNLLPVEQRVGQNLAGDVCPLPTDRPVRVYHARQRDLHKNQTRQGRA